MTNCDFKNLDESAYPPWNFSWVVENELAAFAWPKTKENLNFLHQKGIRHVITLSPEKLPPIADSKLEGTVIPVVEFEPPTLNDITMFIDICERYLLKKEAVGVHCRMGLGRTGVMAACFLVHFHGMAPESAIVKLRIARPGSVETYEQERAVIRYHDYLRTRQKNIKNSKQYHKVTTGAFASDSAEDLYSRHLTNYEFKKVQQQLEYMILCKDFQVVGEEKCLAPTSEGLLE
ncbi:hypothetical protein NQ314_016149, partial [Rhamnusium bicolor]